MTEIRSTIAAIVPKRMLDRPVDHRGFPVPWFVTERDTLGNWDFRIITRERQIEALRFKRCWICGHKLGRNVSFAAGPMCGINRTSGEPPQHRECALFAVRACPFMLSPLAKRSCRNMVERGSPQAGGLERNPGVSMVWSCVRYQIMQPDRRSILIRMGEPTEISFWREGREATREEIVESIESGIHHLKDVAAAEGPEALMALGRMTAEFMNRLPPAVTA